MIRVNLLKNRVNEQPTQMTSVSASVGEAREAAVKIAFLVLATAVLMIVEGQNIRKLNDDVVRVQAQISELEAQAAAKAQEAEGVKDIEKQARELEDKLKILKLLSRLRLREVKTLDFMQSSVPEKVWLKSIKYAAENTSVEEGRFEFVGHAVATEDLSEFVKRLEDSAYLVEVIVVKNQEMPVTGRSTTVRDFVFTADVESKK